MEIEIFADKCMGCGRCVENCLECTRFCPNHAIKVRKSHKGKNEWAFVSPRFWFVSFGFLIGLMVILFFFNQ